MDENIELTGALREEIIKIAREAAREYIEDGLSADIGSLAAEGINRRRRAQGKPDLDL